MTRTGAADSLMIHVPCIDHDRARWRGDVLLFIGTHARKCELAVAQFQEEISFECKSLCQRCLGGVADETLDVSNRFRRMQRQAACNLHRAIESLATDGFVHQSLPFGFTWSEGIAHEDVHERGWRSDGAWQPLRAAGPGNESKVRLQKSDQVVAILSDTKIAGERELESTGQGCAGNGGDYRFWHALAQRDRLVQESPVVGRVLRPLATGSAQGLCEADKRSDGIMTNKIAGCAASHDDNANIGVARESVQRRGERVAHLLVEIDAPCAAQCNNRNAIRYSCRQNIGVHRPPFI